MAKFSEFPRASIQHIEGKRNVVADFLSHPECDSDSSNCSDSDDCLFRNETAIRVRIQEVKETQYLCLRTQNSKIVVGFD